jgi:hypothetical protein
MDLEVKITNLMANRIIIDKVELTWAWKKDGTTYTGGDAQIALELNTTTPYNSPVGPQNNISKVTWDNGDTIQSNETKSFAINAITKRSGTLIFDVSIYEVGNPTPQTQRHEVVIPITHIAFDNGHKAMMFWILYHETSEYRMGRPLTDEFSPSLNLDFLNTTVYCNPNSSKPAFNDEPSEDISEFRPLVSGVSHCDPPSFARIAAHTFINGMINNERSSGLGAEYSHYVNNYAKVAGLRTDFYEILSNPVSGSEFKCKDSKGKDLKRFDDTLELYPQLAVPWMWDYAQCMRTHWLQAPNDPYDNFNEAYTFFMGEIDLAIADIKSQQAQGCNSTALNNNLNYPCDPSNGAFAMLSASPSIGSIALQAKVGNGSTMVTNAEIQIAYNALITTLKSGYFPSYPALLRPILRVEEDTRENSSLQGQITGYTWFSLSFRQANDQRHVPR